MNDDMHSTIVGAMEAAGLKAVKFDRPLKSVYALVKLTKEIEPRHLAERSQAVGWCIGTLLDRFAKELFNVRSLVVHNEKDKVVAEAVVCISGLTFEDDHVAWLDSLVAGLAGEDYPSHGYCWERRYWQWDSAERISEVMGFTQEAGDGEVTGVLDGSKR